MVLLLCAGSAAAQAAPSDVTAPVVLERAQAVYPKRALAARRGGLVVLEVLISAEGTVGGLQIKTSAGAAFDAAASAAVLRWRFKPATRAGRAVAAKIRVPFRFVPPSSQPSSRPASQPSSRPSSQPSATAPSSRPSAAASNGPPSSAASGPARAGAAKSDDAPIEVDVRGKRRPRSRSASDFVFDHKVLTIAPRQNAADMLQRAPGIFVARPAGEAVAHRIFLRGFDADHGQDIEIYVGPVPINQPSHIHGQGYADLNFVIPEVVSALKVTEGVYDPRQGDFAVAGSARFVLGVPQRGILLRTTLGSFGRVRVLARWAPREHSEETFAAAFISRTDGFGESRGALSGGTIGQYGFAIGRWRALLHAAAFGSRANIAGVLRKDDLDAGRVGYYDNYSDPTATAQSALSSRVQLALTLERPSTSGARSGMSLWLALSAFRLRVNFTGYTESSRVNPDWVGRGDLNEQENRHLAIGGRFYHRTRRFAPWSWLAGNFELGVQLRTDLIDQAQRLLQAPQNEVWDERVDASIWGADIGLYADLDLRISRWLRLRGGLRADVLYYDVEDALGNFIPPYQKPSHIVGYRRTAIGVALGPRATLELKPLRWLALHVAYGEGYRSPQARQLEEGENAPFVKVRGADLGARIKLFDERITLSTAAYVTFLSTDLAFDPATARLERTGRSSRKGFVAHLMARPWRWLTASLSVTFVNATLDEPPPATPDNPDPPFEEGQLLPQVPPWVLRADVGFDRALLRVAGGALGGRLGVGASFLSPRPLPFSERADAVFLLDASAALSWRGIELGVELFNLLGREYAATEFSFASYWNPSALRSRVPARHIAAGPPRRVLFTLSARF